MSSVECINVCYNNNNNIRIKQNNYIYIYIYMVLELLNWRQRQHFVCNISSATFRRQHLDGNISWQRFDGNFWVNPRRWQHWKCCRWRYGNFLGQSERREHEEYC